MSEDMTEQGSNHWGPGHVARKLITVGAAGNQEILRRLARVPNDALGCSAMALGDYKGASFEDVVNRILAASEYLESSGPEYRGILCTDTQHTDGIECPHCGYVEEDHRPYDEESEEYDCPECGHSSRLEVHENGTYSTRAH